MEEQLVELMIHTMEKAESEPVPVEEDVTMNHGPWLHISAQLIHYFIFNYANFACFVTTIQERV